MNHVLKEVGDAPSTGAGYGTDLPFTTEGTEVLTEFVTTHLDPAPG